MNWVCACVVFFAFRPPRYQSANQCKYVSNFFLRARVCGWCVVCVPVGVGIDHAASTGWPMTRSSRVARVCFLSVRFFYRATTDSECRHADEATSMANMVTCLTFAVVYYFCHLSAVCCYFQYLLLAKLKYFCVTFHRLLLAVSHSDRLLATVGPSC